MHFGLLLALLTGFFMIKPIHKNDIYEEIGGVKVVVDFRFGSMSMYLNIDDIKFRLNNRTDNSP